MVYITRKEHFNAAHKVFRPEWSVEKNFEVFGKCSNPNWHGHNYDLFVTVKGNPDPQTGFVMDLKKLGQIIETKIIDKVDHKNFNLEVDFMKDIIPSTENIAIAFWNEIYSEIISHGCELHCIRLYETERNFVEYFGN